MKLEVTIQNILNCYPMLFGDRESVLLYLFCYYGTGYEWINGELVSENNKTKFEEEIKLENGNKAKSIKTPLDVILEETYNQYEKKKVSLKEFKERIYMIEDEFKKEDNSMSFIDHVFGKQIKKIESIRKEYKNNAKDMLSKKYSPIYNIPNDIKEDWKEGLEEVKKILNSI